jgi:hypothetical protein
MERINLNQTALSLGYIAIKRIRQLESSKPARVPSSPLLRHIHHIKILTACVEQVGPDEIIEYEINQDCGVGVPQDEPQNDVEEVGEARRIEGRLEAGDDVFERQSRTSTRFNAREPLSVISEDAEESSRSIIEAADDAPLFATVAPRDEFDREGDYSMDDLYDVYDDDDWETTSTISEDDGPSHIESVPSSSRDKQSWSSASVDTDSDEDEPQTPPSFSSFSTSLSPPLDITMRHPITHELNKREQYRRQAEASNDLSHAFVQQIEEVLCRDIRYHSCQGRPGQMHSHRVSVFA